MIPDKPNTYSHQLRIPLKREPKDNKTVPDYDFISNPSLLQMATSNNIAKTILSASNQLASSILQLTDEIERKNKLDEYYMLLDKIEEYENTLYDMGKLKEAYENLSIY